MSSSSMLTPLMGMLLMQFPMFVVYLGGIVFAFIRLQRNPRPATLVLAGCAVMLAASLVSPIVQMWVLSNRSVSSAGQVFTIVNLVLGVVRAGATVLLIVAAFVARSESDVRPSAFPVGNVAEGYPGSPQRLA